MNIADIYEAVYFCTYDTLMAWAFRKACGCPQPAPRSSTFVKVDRYREADRLMRQRYGVRM